MTIQAIILQKSFSLVGQFLADHIIIEKRMQWYIAGHFCDTLEKRSEFLEYVICQHIPFDKTKEIFLNVVKNHYKEFYEENKKSLKLIDDMNKERNILSHYMIDLSEESVERYNINGSITFRKLKNGFSIEVFDPERIKSYLSNFLTVKDIFDKLKVVIGH